jgi:hypothetical protein
VVESSFAPQTSHRIGERDPKAEWLDRRCLVANAFAREFEAFDCAKGNGGREVSGMTRCSSSVNDFVFIRPAHRHQQFPPTTPCFQDAHNVVHTEIPAHERLLHRLKNREHAVVHVDGREVRVEVALPELREPAHLVDEEVRDSHELSSLLSSKPSNRTSAPNGFASAAIRSFAFVEVAEAPPTLLRIKPC